MSLLSCDVDRERLKALSPRLPLYPGMVNTWVVTFQSQASEADVKRSLSLAWLTLDLPMSTTGLRPEMRDLKIDAWQVGPPAALPSQAERIAIPPEHLPPGHVYAVVSFLYAGNLQELRPWPWAARGFVVQCPEDVLAGVLAVMPPKAPPAEEQTGTVDVFTRTANSLSAASQIVIWGGAALLLLKLHQLTRAPLR